MLVAVTAAVALPAVKPAAVPVTFVMTPEAGVPKAGVVSVGLVRVLLVSVSVVALPTKVSVASGSVIVLVPEVEAPVTRKLLVPGVTEVGW